MSTTLPPLRRTGIVVVVGVGVATAGALVAALGPWGSHVTRFAEPAAPVSTIANGDYHALLGKYVGSNGRVDYRRWKDDAADVAALDRYLSALTSASPETRPDLFVSQPDELSYWINLYNALVLREVIRRWPLDSVNDVRVNATSFVKQGKGFFYDLRFVVGGKETNLYDIENEIIRAQFKDARIHFAINCGSASCPLLRREAFDPATLEGQLESASVQFVNDGKSIQIDEAKKRVLLSKIFDWYEDDFVAFTKARTKATSATLLDFALLYAQEPLRTRLAAARANHFDVAFLDYDWTVNQQDEAPPSVGSARTAPAISGDAPPTPSASH